MEAPFPGDLGAISPAAALAAASLWGVALALVSLRVRPRVAGALGALAILTWISGALEGGGVAAWMLPPVAAGAAIASGRLHR